MARFRGCAQVGLVRLSTLIKMLVATVGMLVLSSAHAGPATHFAVAAPAPATAGSAFSFTVTALDAS